MTSLTERVQEDLVAAMKRKDTLTTSVLRMVKTALHNKEIEKRASLSDAEAVLVLQTLVKQRTEAITQFDAGGRKDLADKERREKQIIESYLPETVAAEDIDRVASEVIDSVGATGPKDMGEVMKTTLSRLRESGKVVDAKLVSQRVKERLEALGRGSGGS